MIKTVLKNNRLLCLGFLAVLLRLRGLQQALLLFLPGFGCVLLQQPEQLTSLVLVDCHVELVERWWDLQTLEKNAFHPLQLDVLWPPCEACHIALGLDVATKTKVSWSLLKEWVLANLLALRRREWSCSHLLLTSFRCRLFAHGDKS